ncbi:hypothetical protein CDAR_531201 [Caerostris darwini]|uniref:Uncharacterized protein n=1 Tax=Caerostris darwini TaxID=1538125 RepID=A0AAV4TW40_9ARAC|nr:hypothetical protein CDAR_531201 [Caerostris darwini]
MEFCKITVSFFDRSLSRQKVRILQRRQNSATAEVIKLHRLPYRSLLCISKAVKHTSHSLSAHDPCLITLDLVTPLGFQATVVQTINRVELAAESNSFSLRVVPLSVSQPVNKKENMTIPLGGDVVYCSHILYTLRSTPSVTVSPCFRGTELHQAVINLSSPRRDIKLSSLHMANNCLNVPTHECLFETAVQ